MDSFKRKLFSSTKTLTKTPPQCQGFFHRGNSRPAPKNHRRLYFLGFFTWDKRGIFRKTFPGYTRNEVPLELIRWWRGFKESPVPPLENPRKGAFESSKGFPEVGGFDVKS